MYKFYLLIGCFSFVSTKDLPSYFPRCYRNDPKLNECLVKATETVKPFLIKGVPELNIPSIEPFTVPEIDLQQGSQALNFKAKLHNVTIHGLSTYKLTRFDFDVPNFQFFCEGSVEKLNIDGIFSVNGKVLIAPIEGQGNFKCSVGKSSLKLYQKCKKEERKGLIYLRPEFTNSTISVGEPKVQLDGLFQNNQQLNKATNDVINDNIDVLMEDMKPVLEQVITHIIEDLVIKALTEQIPYDTLYAIKN